jgi:hypothetical protein
VGAFQQPGQEKANQHMHESISLISDLNQAFYMVRFLRKDMQGMIFMQHVKMTFRPSRYDIQSSIEITDVKTRK